MALADTARLIASLELQDKFTGPAKRAEGAVGGLDRKVSTLGATGRRAGAGLGSLVGNLAKIAAVGATVTLGAAAVAITASVNAASDLNEEIDKSDVVFGKAAGSVQKFAENSAAIGLSSAEALGAAGNFGNMFNTIGLAQGASAEMSTTLVTLASDMASFNNEDPSEMLDKIRSGLAGESEPLKRFGVLLSEAEVKNFALREGIAKQGETLTEAQKVQARYGLILEQTAIQQGNYADTSESLANQQRTLKANVTNTAAAFGTRMLPAISRVIGKINDLFVDKQDDIARFGRRFGKAIDNLFNEDNLNRGFRKVSGTLDKLLAFNPNDLNFDFGDVGGKDSGKIASIADSIGGIAEQVKDLPWKAIGDAAKLLGTGSRALLDAFLGLPPWVQTAVLTGWGLNKLTGGALTSIAGTLATGLIKGVLGMNAGVVNITAGTVNGPGGVAGGGRGFLGGVAGGLAVAAGVGLSAVAVETLVEGVQDSADIGQGIRDSIDHADKTTLKGVQTRLDIIDATVAAADDNIVSQLFGGDDILRRGFSDERTRLVQIRDGVRYADQQNRTVGRAVADRVQKVADTARAGFSDNGAKIVRVHGAVDSARASTQRSEATLQQIRDKRSTVNVTVNTGVTISASQVALRVQQLTQSVTGPRLE